jgi:hypothetical protein
MRGEGMTPFTEWRVEVLAGGRAAYVGFPQAVGNEADDTLLGLEGPGNADERGGLGEDARRR